jgi:hypothetical protein
MMQERYAKSDLKARDKYLESSGWSYFGRTLVPPHPHPTPAGRSLVSLHGWRRAGSNTILRYSAISALRCVYDVRGTGWMMTTESGCRRGLQISQKPESELHVELDTAHALLHLYTIPDNVVLDQVGPPRVSSSDGLNVGVP